MKKFGNHDYGGTGGPRNATLQNGSTAVLQAALTILSMYGYDTQKLRMVVFDGVANRALLQENDRGNDPTLGGGSPGALLTTQADVVSYVNSRIGSGKNPAQGFNATTATNFPAGATLQDTFRVTGAGTIHGQVLAVGDILEPAVANPSITNAADWLIFQANVDAANSSALGLVRLVADLAELVANAAGNAQKVVTVKSFNDFMASMGYARIRPLTVNLVAGATPITHNLNTTKLSVEFTDISGEIDVDWNVSDANSIIVNSPVAVSNVNVMILG